MFCLRSYSLFVLIARGCIEKESVSRGLELLLSFDYVKAFLPHQQDPFMAMRPRLTIREDDLSGQAIQDLLAFHQADALAQSPPGTSYALDLSGLQTPDISVWTVWRGDALAGCGALKAMSADQAEIKSMRTATAFLRQGVAAAMLRHLIETARKRGHKTLCLETGTNQAYAPAVALYQKHGFVSGPVYGDYIESPHNQYFYLNLAAG
jgi:putative acetyltransferase